MSGFTVSAQQAFPDLVPDQSAQSMLEAELPSLISALDNETEGTPAFQLAERTLNMYNHTWEGLTSGRDLTDALRDSFNEYSLSTNGNPMSADEMPDLSKNGADYGDEVFDNLINFLTL